MAVGQGVLGVVVDDAAREVLETRLVLEAARGAHHVAQLRTVLELHALDTGQGLGLSTVPHAALLLGCSEHRASCLLSACNLGPCCRRHHQVKQQGWTKTRTPAGVRWTGRTGRLGDRIRRYDTAWTLDLDDPYLWLDPEPADARCGPL